MVLFRCNAGPEIGFGHLVRCRALAQALHKKGEDCVMVGPDQSYATPVDHKIFGDWIPVPEWSSSSDDAQRLISIAQVQQSKWLVLDDYRVDEAYQIELGRFGSRWLQFDAGANKPLWADVILNASPAAFAEDYSTVVRNPNARLLLGPAYAILRPEFQDVTPRRLGRPVKKILVTFGGGDDRGVNQFVLSALLPVAELDQRFIVISGANNPSNPILKEWIETNGQGRVTLCIDPDNVAQIMLSCDLAVMAGGASTHEAVRCGLPMILISIASNQEKQCDAWDSLGEAEYLGDFSMVKTGSLVDAFFSIRKKIVKRTSPLKYTGNGAQFISEILSTR